MINIPIMDTLCASIEHSKRYFKRIRRNESGDGGSSKYRIELTSSNDTYVNSQ